MERRNTGLEVWERWGENGRDSNWAEKRNGERMDFGRKDWIEWKGKACEEVRAGWDFRSWREARNDELDTVLWSLGY